ncbi:NfeD family protein [Gimibacter soli]|uniref:NfeD family protein n=1 Tax=Gimibacter soli TaxID=3024400 RepID=A0AAF0BLM9_9PROT|nr:NfeD family protein [Gimibacter soli]WCL53640.1 NfeD family protein [Gimibacter soli]
MELESGWLVANAHWLWWGAGLLLLAGEMVLPGVYLLWIGIAGIITGAFAFIWPGSGLEGQGVVFAVLAGASIYIASRYIYSRDTSSTVTSVNRKGQGHVGKVYVVVDAIANGRGHVQVGDSRWLAEGPDAAVGTPVRVVAVDGIVLIVAPLENTAGIDTVDDRSGSQLPGGDASR